MWAEHKNALAAHAQSRARSSKITSSQNWSVTFTLHPAGASIRSNSLCFSFRCVLFCFTSNKRPLCWKYSKWSSKLLHFVRWMKSKMRDGRHERRKNTDRNGSSSSTAAANNIMPCCGTLATMKWVNGISIPNSGQTSAASLCMHWIVLNMNVDVMLQISSHTMYTLRIAAVEE